MEGFAAPWVLPRLVYRFELTSVSYWNPVCQHQSRTRRPGHLFQCWVAHLKQRPSQWIFQLTGKLVWDYAFQNDWLKSQWVWVIYNNTREQIIRLTSGHWANSQDPSRKRFGTTDRKIHLGYKIPAPIFSTRKQITIQIAWKLNSLWYTTVRDM